MTAPSVRTVHASGVNRTGSAITLAHRTAGYEPAGAGTRHADEGWAYLYQLRDGTRGGQWYGDEPSARAHFNRFNVAVTNAGA